jgi:hypothetical protein
MTIEEMRQAIRENVPPPGYDVTKSEMGWYWWRTPNEPGRARVETRRIAVQLAWLDYDARGPGSMP